MDLLAVFIEFPWLALLPAVAFGVAGYYRRRPSVWAAGAAWLAYAAYETAMAKRILCSGECNIRVDLLLIYPALLALSLVAAFAAFRAGRFRPPDG
jgi:hypothetical protein